MAGISFLPGANMSPQDRQNAALRPGQSPIDVISLNLPKILGARPLASQNLLMGGSSPAMPMNASAPMTGGGSTPEQVVMQALMKATMSVPGEGGGINDELRRQLTQLFGTPTQAAPPPSITVGGDRGVVGPTIPPPRSAPETPTFTPGDNMHINNSPFNIRPVTQPFSQPGMLRK